VEQLCTAAAANFEAWLKESYALAVEVYDNWVPTTDENGGISTVNTVCPAMGG
jgi:hypothetical protein